MEGESATQEPQLRLPRLADTGVDAGGCSGCSGAVARRDSEAEAAASRMRPVWMALTCALVVCCVSPVQSFAMIPIPCIATCPCS